MRRREFITLLGGATIAWPLAARAQQPAMPVIAFLSGTLARPMEYRLAAFRRGLSETGYIERQNLAIEYRWAEDQEVRLPALAADLVQRQVAVIATGGVAPTIAVKRESGTIPTVFMVGGDPVDLGLVASLNRPGGNVTGVYFLSDLLAAKQLELLGELVPRATVVGLLVNPNYAATEVVMRDVQGAANALGKKLVIVKAGREADFEPAFATLSQQNVTAVLVHSNAFFNAHTENLVALAARNTLPVIYGLSEYAAAGGLMSYGASVTDAYRQAGIYTGRILKGSKPSELPVMQSVKVELTINLKTAKALGINVPQTLVVAADEVIE